MAVLAVVQLPTPKPIDMGKAFVPVGSFH